MKRQFGLTVITNFLAGDPGNVRVRAEVVAQDDLPNCGPNP